MRIVEAQKSEWNTRYVLALEDGAQVEAVHYRGDTLCISSQVGCAVRCPFCASGANGLGRNLTFEELVAQVECIKQTGANVARTTVSGVGEPLHNIDNLERFIAFAHAQRIPASLTTSGASEERLSRAIGWTHNGLTLSVHAGREETRARLVPKAPTLDALFNVLYERVPQITRRRRHKTALAYLVMQDENDSDAEIDAFIERAKSLPIFVHLYAHNAVPTSEARATSRTRFEQIYERMRNGGLTVRMSSQARVEPNGGCGTLVALRKKKTDALSQT